jgi:hypothetical protein
VKHKRLRTTDIEDIIWKHICSSYKSVRFGCMKKIVGNNGGKGISYTFNKNSLKYVPKYNHNYRKDRINGNTPLEIIKGVRQGCPLSPILFNIYIDKVMKDWLQVIKPNILVKDLILNTILFADDQVIVASTEDE